MDELNLELYDVWYRYCGVALPPSVISRAAEPSFAKLKLTVVVVAADGAAMTPAAAAPSESFERIFMVNLCVERPQGPEGERSALARV
jgi:hypothetical protein